MASESQIIKAVPELLKSVTVKDLLVTRVIYLCVLPIMLVLFGPRDMIKKAQLLQKENFAATFAFYDAEMALDTMLDVASCVV